jgi:pimeloyl-ACP methyl ester carboxylesterase
MSERPPILVLVHGACHTPESWNRLTPHLAARDYDRLAVDLPSSGDPFGDMYDDARVIRAAVDEAGPCVVICHSYGGVPATHGLHGAVQVRLIVYLAAFMLDEGQRLIDVATGADDAWIESADGHTIAPIDARTLFYHRCDDTTAAAAVATLRPQRTDAFLQPIGPPAWRDIPSAYLICTDDRAIAPAAQRQMAAKTAVRAPLDSDHSPFLSRPELTAAILDTVIQARLRF